SQVSLQDDDIPLQVRLTGWSPFIPTDNDNSSLPVGTLEYVLRNTGAKKIDAVFSYNTKNFLATDDKAKNSIGRIANGFILQQEGTTENRALQGTFAAFTTDTNTIVDHCWFRGGWWDPITMAWNTVRDGLTRNTEPVEKDAPGASLFVPFSLA